MNQDIRNLKILIFLLCSVGIISLFSASSAYAASRFSDYTYFFNNQVVRLAIGLLLLVMVSFIDYRLYRKYSKEILISCWALILLGYLTSQHLPTSRGFILFGRNIISTSDVAKFGAIIFLASFIEQNKKKINDFKILFLELIPYIALTLLLIFFQPDMSTTFTIGLILLSMVYVAGINTKYILYTILPCISIVVVKILSTEFQRERFLSWFNAVGDDQSSGSLLALSSGGLIGNGLDGSIIKKGFLPAAHTDFMLPIIGEEFGFLGIAFIFILFFLFLYHSIKIIQKIQDLFGFFLALGIVLNIIIYFLINSAYSVGIFPTTGLPLPFMSYGGSHIILTLSSMGIILNLARSNINKRNSI